MYSFFFFCPFLFCLFCLILELDDRYMDKKLQIKLNANRVVVGTLRGFDQFMNLVVDNTVEVIGNEKNDIGMVVIRGNSVVMIEALEPVGRT
uniref:Small nuclear ribonucleoprotein G n=1 Tax=Elaeis guineensis var. tenera TaxID=51953 RepID=A0A6J0PRR3_ELAGV|nr:probable small nuclear ribonucleoprotein G isoform X1 [Elaeis guineensis]